MKTKHYVATMVVLMLIVCSNAFCGSISVVPLQSKDQVLKVVVCDLGYSASMYDIYDHLKEAMEKWKVKDAKRIRYKISIHLMNDISQASLSRFLASQARLRESLTPQDRLLIENVEKKSYFVIRYFLIK